MKARITLKNQEKIIRFKEKETCEYLRIMEVDTIKQVEKIDKNLKSASKEKEKTTRNLKIGQKYDHS